MIRITRLAGVTLPVLLPVLVACSSAPWAMTGTSGQDLSGSGDAREDGGKADPQPHEEGRDGGADRDDQGNDRDAAEHEDADRDHDDADHDKDERDGEDHGGGDAGNGHDDGEPDADGHGHGGPGPH